VLLYYSIEKALINEPRRTAICNVAPLWFIPLIIASYDIILPYYIKKTFKIQEGIYSYIIKVTKKHQIFLLIITSLYIVKIKITIVSKLGKNMICIYSIINMVHNSVGESIL